MPFQTPITIKEAVNNIHEKHYLLPAIQREVVWDGEQIERLFDSLMRGYGSTHYGVHPIGATEWAGQANRIRNVEAR